MKSSRRTFVIGSACLSAMLAAGCTNSKEQKPVSPSAASASAPAPAPTAGVPPAAKSPEQMMWLAQQAAKAAGIQAGNPASRKIAYTFFDPRCPHCTTLYHSSRPLAQQASMVWIPVAFLGQQSAELSTALLSAANPSQSLEAMEMHQQAPHSFNADKEASGRQLVYSNTQALLNMMREQSASVPYTIFKDADGHVYERSGEMTTEDLKLFLRL